MEQQYIRFLSPLIQCTITLYFYYTFFCCFYKRVQTKIVYLEEIIDSFFLRKINHGDDILTCKIKQSEPNVINLNTKLKIIHFVDCLLSHLSASSNSSAKW